MDYGTKIAMETEIGNLAAYNRDGQKYWLLIIREKSRTAKSTVTDRNAFL
jgi:hypothetical protein